MKIEITDEDLESYRKALSLSQYGSHAGIYGGPNDVGEYSMNFKILDGEKASFFLGSLLYNKELVEYLKEKAGLEITSLNLYKAKNVNHIVDTLQSIIDELKE